MKAFFVSIIALFLIGSVPVTVYVMFRFNDPLGAEAFASAKAAADVLEAIWVIFCILYDNVLAFYLAYLILQVAVERTKKTQQRRLDSIYVNAIKFNTIICCLDWASFSLYGIVTVGMAKEYKWIIISLIFSLVGVHAALKALPLIEITKLAQVGMRNHAQNDHETRVK
jgi:hypothetical protein